MTLIEMVLGQVGQLVNLRSKLMSLQVQERLKLKNLHNYES